tara:strand:+ start:1081 stop:2133 length:1053 start_codon:yes stop_codon:yes gene_type:complete
MGIKIGITGTFCSGKDTFAEYLAEKGYKHFSLSDILRDILKEHTLEVTRENLQKYGTKLRKKEGNNILAKRALEKLNDKDNYIITSIRNPLEIKELVQSKNFVLVAIEAPPLIRFERMVERGRKEAEPDTFEKFQEAEKKELASDDDNAQQIQNCIDMAQFSITNDSTKEDFISRIEEVLPKITEAAEHSRPTWDEYFMELAKVIGKRGTCNRGRAGCIIVKDKRILSTGYVGSPPGMAHCDDLGHWFKQTIHEDQSVTQHCIRTVHAEANAIAQAANSGVNVHGSTLFCKMEPCLDCTKLMISAGIKRVVCEKRYHAAKESREMLEEAGVKLEVLQDTIEEYAGQKKLK